MTILSTNKVEHSQISIRFVSSREMADYIVVHENGDVYDGIELELDEVETLTISTVWAQFGPYLNRLFYHNPDSGRKRGKDRS